MYIRKDIHKSLRLEAKMAEGSSCFSWAKLFRECSYLLRKKDREIDRLRAALERIAACKTFSNPAYMIDIAHAALAKPSPSAEPPGAS